MTLKDLLGLGAGERSVSIPAAVMLPVAILAGVLAFAVLQLPEAAGGPAVVLFGAPAS